MNSWGIAETLLTAIALAIIFGIARLFQRMNTLETQISPLLKWYEQVSIDALRKATNPIDPELTALGQKYIDHYTGQGSISLDEKQRLVEGLQEILANPSRYPEKQMFALLSLRFIESREGTSLTHGEKSH